MNCTKEQFIAAFESEEMRIDFIIKRDGIDAAVLFADQTFSTYTNAMSYGKGMASTREHKYKFFASCIVFERTLAIGEREKAHCLALEIHSENYSTVKD